MLLIGGAATLTLDQLWLQSWAKSGRAFPIGHRYAVDLPSGQSLVYYESPVAVPLGDVTLRIYDSEDDMVPVLKPEKDISYSLLFTGWTGRALWTLNLRKAGRYGLLCMNHNFLNDADMPHEDRIVFLKQPNSLDEVSFVRTFIDVTGATITGVLVIVFYLLHGVALARRAVAEKSSSPLAASRA